MKLVFIIIHYHHHLDDHLSQHQQQRQPLLCNIDKDIEYVESRLRGQTTISLPVSHPLTIHHDIELATTFSNHIIYNALLSPSDDQQQQQQQQQHVRQQTHPTQINKI